MLQAQINEDSGDLFSRANPRGHVTGSMLVLNADASKVLLIHHRFLDRWLQPGGHVEQDASLWEAARREVREETGVSPARFDGETAVFDIDTHAIPANAKKGEGAHVHHDFLFLGLADDRESLAPELVEVSGARWAPVSVLNTYPGTRWGRLWSKLDGLLYRATRVSRSSGPGGR